MVGSFLGWVQARARRLWWCWGAAAVFYAVAPLPSLSRLLAAVALGVALTVAGRGGPGHAVPAQQAGGVYDPGALLTAVVAVLAAEGVWADGGPAMGACIDLLAGQGITPVAGADTPAAWTVTTALPAGSASRPGGVAVPVGMFTACVYLILDTDGVLPVPMTGPGAEAFVNGCVRILNALGLTPDPRPGQPHEWPVMAMLIDTGIAGGQP